MKKDKRIGLNIKSLSEGVIMKKVVLSIMCILMAISICSCTLNTSSSKVKVNSEDVNLNKENVSSEVLNTNKLYGYSMDELLLKYAVKVSEEKRDSLTTKKGKTIEEEKALLLFMSGGTAGTLGKYNDLCGNFSYLCTSVPSKEGIDASPIPIMILQGFLKEDITSQDDYIYVNEKKYLPEQLKEYIVYEDDKMIVYDMGYLVSGMEISDYLNTLDENITPNQIDLFSEIYESLKSSKESILMPS